MDKVYELLCLTIKIVDQRFDGYEVWASFGRGRQMPLGFSLEYFISGDVQITKKNYGFNRSMSAAEHFAEEFVEKYRPRLCGKNRITAEEYLEWSNNNIDIIKKAAALLQT